MKLLMAFCAFILLGLNDGSFGVLIPSIQRHYQIEKSTLSLIFLTGSLGFLTAGFLVGRLYAWLGMRLFLGAGAAITSVGFLIYSQQPPFPLLLINSYFLGFGFASLDAGLNVYVAALPRSASLLNYLHGFYGIGALIGPAFATLLLDNGIAWNQLYLILAVIAFLLVAGFALIFSGIKPDAPSSEKNDNRKPLQYWAVWLSASFLLVYVGLEVTLGSWSFSFLTQARQEEDTLSGLIVSGYWLGLTMGRLLLARVAEKIGVRPLMRLCLIGVAFGVILLWISPNSLLASAGLWLAGFSLGPLYPGTISLMPDLVPPPVLPGAIGFLSSFGSMGAAFFPWLAGNLMQFTGLWSLLPFCISLAALMLLIWFGLSKLEIKKA
jgi:fucose permease